MSDHDLDLAELLEDEDGAPYPESVQAAVRDRLAAQRAALAEEVMALPLSGFIGGDDMHPEMSASAMRFMAAAVVDIETTKRIAWAPTTGSAASGLCRKAVGTRPSWMGQDQYASCRCVLPLDHKGDCACEHTKENR